MEQTRLDPLRYFIVFGSLAGRFGGIGQTDYAMANEVAGKLVAWYRQQRPDCRAFAMHWPAWRGMGMANRSTSRWSLELAGHHPLSPAEGVGHLLREMANPTPPAEVVLVHPAEIPPELSV